MGLLDRLLGRSRETAPAPHHGPPSGAVPPAHDGASGDERAIERYRYLLRTARPDQVEQAHAEAFSQLTPDQRQQVLTQLASVVPESERPRSDDPNALARTATRAEMRSPGTLERAFGGGGGMMRGGPGFGSMVGAGLLGTIGGLVIGTAVADALFDSGAGDSGLFGGEDGEGGGEAADAEGGDGFAGEDVGSGDYGSGDYGSGDMAGGGDFGGGDFGGGF